ncbi:MAG TPA: DMT family transporter [Actinocrinis sp.]|nr:DMT family transporter [Actinocrinis sp.]
MDSSAPVIPRPTIPAELRSEPRSEAQPDAQSPAHPRPAWVAMSFCATACLLVGSSFSAAHLLNHYPYATGQALRYAIAALVLLTVIRFQNRTKNRAAAVTPANPAITTTTTATKLTPRNHLRIALVAATGAVGFNLAILAAERSAEPAVPGVVVGCSPLVVAVLVPLLARRRPSARLAGAALLVVAGAAVVQGFGHTTLAGLAFSLLALAGEVCFSLIAVPLLRLISPLTLSAYISLAAAAESAVVALGSSGLRAVQLPTLPETAALLWQALPVTVLAFCLWYAGLRRLGPERAQLFVGLMPIAAAACAPALGAGSLGWAQLTGSGLVCVGIVLGSSSARRRANARRRDT